MNITQEVENGPIRVIIPEAQGTAGIGEQINSHIKSFLRNKFAYTDLNHGGPFPDGSSHHFCEYVPTLDPSYQYGKPPLQVEDIVEACNALNRGEHKRHPCSIETVAGITFRLMTRDENTVVVLVDRGDHARFIAADIAKLLGGRTVKHEGRNMSAINATGLSFSDFQQACETLKAQKSHTHQGNGIKVTVSQLHEGAPILIAAPEGEQGQIVKNEIGARLRAEHDGFYRQVANPRHSDTSDKYTDALLIDDDKDTRLTNLTMKDVVAACEAVNLGKPIRTKTLGYSVTPGRS